MPSEDVDAKPLADLIESLRSELQDARNRGAKEPLKFDIDEIELELDVKITKATSKEGSVKGGFKFKFWVVTEANAETTGNASNYSGREQTHRMKLKLRPNFDGPEDARRQIGNPRPERPAAPEK